MVAKKQIEGESVSVGNNDATALASRTFTDSELHGIRDFADAVAVFQQVTGREVSTVTEELGDGFLLLDDKRKLAGVPLFFMDWDMKTSKELVDDEGNPRKFVTARVVADTRKGIKKYLITDGSTGICQQLQGYTDRTGFVGGLMAPHGLRASDFTYTDPKSGQKSPATVFYVDLAPDDE